ncbi:MAG: DUF1801 domain-containing protein [Myxococcota bacterium]
MATRKKAKPSASSGKSSRTTTPRPNRSATGTARKAPAKKRRASEASTTAAKPRLTRRPPEAAELEEANPASRGARKKEQSLQGPASIVSKRDGALDSYLITLEPTAKQVVAELRKIVAAAVPKASETIRWRNLCWEYEGVMCYASSAKKHVTFGFFRGAELTDPDHVLEGVKNKTERVVKLKDVSDINAAQLGSWVKEAAKLNSKR